MKRVPTVHDDSEDFAAFYASTQAACTRAVCAVVGDAALAEELAAEAFARAFAHWHTVRRHPSPQAWVIRVALNTHVSWWRKRRREAPWPAVDPTPGHAGDHAADPLDARILAALRALPKRQREVIALRVFLDLDTQYIATALGISPGTVATHFTRASAALRAALAPSPEEEHAAS